MSLFKTKNAVARVEYSGFGGIDRSAPEKEGRHAYNMANYRILSDGSLETRCGYRPICQFSENVRDVLTGEFDGGYKGYVLAGCNLYSVDLVSGEKTLIGSVGGDSGRASLFCYRGSVYLVDGEDIYILSDGAISSAEGYVPMLGEDWGSSYPGKIKEPLNALTPRARISYVITDASSVFLSTMYPVSTVEALYLNGELLDPSVYMIDKELRTLSMTGLKVGDRLTAYLTFESDGNDRKRVALNTEAEVFGGAFDSRVFLWGGENKNAMFVSGAVSEEELRRSKEAYGDSGELYFPVEHEFTVGDGRYPISAVGRHLDRLLVFTEGETWVADSDTYGNESHPVMRINTSNGCRSRFGFARLGNDPINLGRDRVMRWTSETDKLEDCNAYSVSDGISELLPDGFFVGAVAYEDKKRGEVLFSSGTEGDKRVFVYGNGGADWYIFENIGAERFFDVCGEVGFLAQNGIYVFDRSLTVDIPAEGEIRAIDSRYEGNMLYMEDPYSLKRLMGIEMRADGGGEDIKVLLTSDKSIADSAVFCGSGGVVSWGRRMRCGRFFGVRLKIFSEATARQRIYKVTLVAKR